MIPEGHCQKTKKRKNLYTTVLYTPDRLVSLLDQLHRLQRTLRTDVYGTVRMVV